MSSSRSGAHAKAPRLDVPLARPPRPATPLRAVLAALLAVAGCALLVASLLGFADPAPAGVACALALLASGAVLWIRPLATPAAVRVTRWIRPFLVVAAGPVGFLLVELPCNQNLFAMEQAYAAVNVELFCVLFAIVFFAGQATRGAVAAFVSACLVAGIANGFVIEFKGQPVLPADLFALSTAAEVAGGYSYVLQPGMLGSLGLWTAYVAALSLMPSVRLSALRVAINSVLAIVLALGLAHWYDTTDIGEEYDVKVDVWSVRESYSRQGTALGFAKRTQDLTPDEPPGYSPERATEILAAYPQDNADASAPQPAVIAVMNETFSDLSRYPGMEDSNARPDGFYQVADEAIEAGTALASAMGGGTCNSEFEFLTGSSMAHMGTGVYPYVLYDLEGADSLASYFKGLGYGTCAIHPNEASNWRRSLVYDQLGFDDFASIEDFEGADTLRGLVTDAATYDKVLDLLAQSDEPQFIFDVTMQNHGGYDKGTVPPQDQVSVTLPDGSTISGLDEFASCIKRSDEDLVAFVDKLDAMERPVVLCFFGDHQPGFSNELFEATHDGQSADDIGLEAVQERYVVPYLIWANKAAREAGVGSALEADKPAQGMTSLNYLGARLALATGLPLEPRQRFLLDEETRVPATNMNGFMTPNGNWHYHSDDVERDVRDDAAIVQYDNLFG